MSAWLIPIETLARRRGGDDARAVGTKAARLAWLVRHDFAVPQAWVLPEDAFTAALRELPPGCDPKVLLRAANGSAGFMRAAEAREELLRAPMPKGLANELEQLWREAKEGLPCGLAVRSSATCDDGTLASMAGLAESRLGVRGGEAIADAIRHVWASIAGGRALAYLAAHGVRDVGMAVIIQRVVEAEASGAMITQAPDEPARQERIINASMRLGSPVADGVAAVDLLRVDSKGRVIVSCVAHKTHAVAIGRDGPTEVVVEGPDRPALSLPRVTELAEIALRLEKLESVPWDVEFACDAARTWIVQAHPVAGHGFPDGGDALTVWSGVHLGEALPGVATPLTWSIAGAFSEVGFRSAFASLGCSVPKNARLVGNVHGRSYLNLTQFMRIAMQVPWLDPRALVELGGGTGGDELAAQVADVSRRGFYARLPLTAARVVREQFRIDDTITRFEQFAEKARSAHSALDLAILPDEALARTLRDLQSLLERTGAVMLACASSALGTHLALRAMLGRVAPIDAERLAQALTAGIRDIEAVRPAIGLMRVAQIARGEPEARAILEKERVEGIDALPEGATRRALLSFLELYGDRAAREAELATARWREDPRPVLTMLRVALRGDDRGVEPALARARAHADAEMVRLVPQLNLAEQTAVRHLVARSQKFQRLRERMRTWVTRVLGMLREAILDADRRLRRLVPALATDDRIGAAFFLTLDELVNALRTSRADVAPLVRARRAEFARDKARPDPPATFVGAPPPVFLPPAGGDHLRGLAASVGIVEGRARVMRSADEMETLEPGEILIARTTDVGWTPLFLTAAGVVTELGGPMSHAAVVARELGVPSVVNVDGVTRAIRTGDHVRVDGDRGVLERTAR